MKRLRWVLLAMLFVVAAVLACGTEGFDPASKVDTVRLFVVAADKPYAKPGDTVTLEALWTDARPQKPRAAKLFWIPILCLNPPQDLYYLCFANPGDASNQAGSSQLLPLFDAGNAANQDAGSSPFSAIPTGTDLSSFLPQGNSYSFTLPQDSIIPRDGTDPYGLGIIFNVLCAGQVRFVARDPNGAPQQVPLECTDENGTPLPPSDYVIGISRVYAYDTRTNANPVIDVVTSDNVPVDPTMGLTFPVCTADKQAKCQENHVEVHVPDADWELNPGDISGSTTYHEQIWVDYYSDIGHFDDDARLLFDTQSGRIDDNQNKFRAPTSPTDGTLWLVVHDNRGGASWTIIPLHIR